MPSTARPARSTGTAARPSPASSPRTAESPAAPRRSILVHMTAHFMRSVFRLSTKILAAAALFGGAAHAQLPAGPGKAETEKVCGTCHEIERSIAPRQDRNGWKQTIDKMVALGANGS